MNTVRFAHMLTLASVTLIAATGCSGSSAAKLAAVSGLVTLDGAPYPNAHVMFTPPQGRPSEGVTDSAGKYELNYLPGVKGAEPGNHTVAITTQYQAPENPGSEPPFKEPIPAKYNAQSTLTAAVVVGKQEVNFDLKSK